MAGEVEWNEAAIGEFTKDTSARAIEIVTERVADDGRHLMPVLNLAITKPPGERWSLPPGHLKASVGTRYGDIPERYGEVTADPVYRFSRKRRHRIYPALSDALALQYGREVP